MDACIRNLSEAATFSTLHEIIGYCKVAIEESEYNKAIFTSDHRLFRFICMPFGLLNVPETFERTMDVNLATIKGSIQSTM